MIPVISGRVAVSIDIVANFVFARLILNVIIAMRTPFAKKLRPACKTLRKNRLYEYR